jgi:hypothetical protein
MDYNYRKINYDIDKYHIDFNDMQSIFYYIINHYEKFILLLLAFVIVYFIDHLTYMNALMYGVAPNPMIGITQTSPQNIQVKSKKKTNKNK